ncbi:DNA mismatch repair endonuclease MutL [Brunnivagina elsteri]|uniref:DNA mismatch repair protein MutL n=1 Tax=Brunnivagina elsteri CCALA 953 TaxID=987040 RepID=A0A2A2TIP4_9CYAN|nr:DNA mismatch repair endonuclease MutL [Calothrix elsteri]PAX53810.1 DNA mismatch repair endonuclease MutL [Calothrix elsteri CCALA 953]
MASTIQTLPNEVVHLIAAGEVIDSFAAVVRELVENSLDAGANRITVYLHPQQWRVRVADNGCGINYEDLENAAIAHSTSKIHEGADLWKIRSLGFRGEALHSLTTLANLEILSRSNNTVTTESRNDGCGFRVVYGAGGKVLQMEATAIAPGTVVTVSNLFGNCRERRQGLPNTNQQMKAVQAIIYQIALCHPQVAWQVWQNDRIWFSLSPAATMGRLLPQILHQVRQGDLHELEVELRLSLEEPNPSAQFAFQPLKSAFTYSSASSPISTSLHLPPNPTCKLHLVIGLPDRCHRHRPDWVRIAVNKRMVKASEIEQSVFSAFHRTLPRDRFPVCLLHLEIAPEHINWNRNPAKSEIYLNNLNFWQEQVSQAIAQALRINSDTVSEAIQTSRVGQLIKVAEAQNQYNPNRSIQPQPSEHQEINQENGSSDQLPNKTFLPNSPLSTQDDSREVTTPKLTAVAQVNKMYIVVEHPDGVWLVEQHIAHERVLYEQICDRWQIVPIEPALILFQLAIAQVEQLQRIGLDIEPFGENLWAVRSVPAMLKQREDCSEAILELSQGGDLQAAQVAVACRSAIRNGTVLTMAEMQRLLEQWQSTRNPRTCPHGRPICLSLPESSLSRYFKRHWVVGKSHGI